ncbi:hypothetical protein PANT_14c00072 [Moesziomyces antarcticus T-34]|uniref:Uncharacterized protein n=1 Tax=Pseudozyma antarctica (strain T-34) TaxID=1151754 RepID=M9M475_PSEA3|nr:hypothetical protein PANT_14c00072 [Moesziomyces antarcticus T-34]
MLPIPYPSGCEVCNGRDAHWNPARWGDAQEQSPRSGYEADTGCPAVHEHGSEEERSCTSASRLGSAGTGQNPSLLFPTEVSKKKSDPATETATGKGPKAQGGGLDPTGRVFQSSPASGVESRTLHQPAGRAFKDATHQMEGRRRLASKPPQNILPLSPLQQPLLRSTFGLNWCRAATYSSGLVWDPPRRQRHISHGQDQLQTVKMCAGTAMQSTVGSLGTYLSECTCLRRAMHDRHRWDEVATLIVAWAAGSEGKGSIQALQAHEAERKAEAVGQHTLKKASRPRLDRGRLGGGPWGSLPAIPMHLHPSYAATARSPRSRSQHRPSRFHAAAPFHSRSRLPSSSAGTKSLVLPRLPSTLPPPCHAAITLLASLPRAWILSGTVGVSPHALRLILPPLLPSSPQPLSSFSPRNALASGVPFAPPQPGGDSGPSPIVSLRRHLGLHRGSPVLCIPSYPPPPHPRRWRTQKQPIVSGD